MTRGLSSSDVFYFLFFSSRRRHTRLVSDWSSDVCSSDLVFIFDLATSTARELRPDFAASVHPVWSPDGKQILFVGLKDANNINTGDWWIAPVDGGAPVRCPTMPSDGSILDPFAWRGDRVYFASETRDIPTIGEIRIDPKTGSVLAAK